MAELLEGEELRQQLSEGALRRAREGGVVDDDVDAAEALRGGAPDTAPGAGNDYDASDEVLCHSSLVISSGTPEASWMMITFAALSTPRAYQCQSSP